MSDTEARKLLKIIRDGNEYSALKVIKFLGIAYQVRKEVRNKPLYKWDFKK